MCDVAWEHRPLLFCMSYTMKIPDYIKQNRLAIAWAGAVAVVLVGMYWEAGSVFVRRWLGESAYYHCMAVPAIAGWFLWRRWERGAGERMEPWLPGFALFGFGLLMYLVYARTGVRMAAGVAFPVILAGIVGAVYGRHLLRVTAVPIGLLIFAVPFPEHVIGMVAMPMQKISAVITGKVAPVLGLQVVQQGINLDLHGFSFVVAQECSGMHSLIALLLTGVVLVELSQLHKYRKVLSVAIIPPIVLLANVVRLTVVLLLAEYFGPELALGAMVHGFSDIIVYLAAVLGFILFIGWLYEHQTKPQSGDMPSSPPKAPGVPVAHVPDELLGYYEVAKAGTSQRGKELVGSSRSGARSQTGEAQQ